MNILILLIKELLLALMRVEKKQDETLKLLVNREKASSKGIPPMLNPMSTTNRETCPLCLQVMTYQQVDIPFSLNDGTPQMETVLVRRCGCEPQPTPRSMPL